MQESENQRGKNFEAQSKVHMSRHLKFQKEINNLDAILLNDQLHFVCGVWGTCKNQKQEGEINRSQCKVHKSKGKTGWGEERNSRSPVAMHARTEGKRERNSKPTVAMIQSRDGDDSSRECDDSKS